MGCLNKSFQHLRTAPADKTSEKQSRTQNHSAKEIQAEDQDDELRQLINTKRQRINFPAATAEKHWDDLDSKIVLKLNSLIGDRHWNTNLPLSVKSSTKLVLKPLVPSNTNPKVYQEEAEGNVKWIRCSKRGT
ncbi:reverse transcriptase [Elysia marginata]|uniref:Reverse transcriptase n=1 Tax=Elysia marginata TaxID=1093978 RepID=A0AAV4IVN1_9GAST|nr:reverse transcriptase [Elysia marginata]